jgi:group I intron endonuclease
MIGIYKITNLVDSKIYIGSSVNIDKRYKEHLVNSTTKSNKYLQNAINKYGKENFKFEVLEECNKEDLKNIEQFWLDKTKCYNSFIGYNIREKAYPLLHIISNPDKIKETILKKGGYNIKTYPNRVNSIKYGIKNYFYGKKGELSLVSKEIFVYNLKGEYIKNFKSLTECCLELKLNMGLVSLVLNKKRNMTNNYMFSNKLENIKPYKNNKTKNIYVYENDILVYIFDSLKEASKKLKISKYLLTKANLTNKKVKNLLINY